VCARARGAARHGENFGIALSALSRGVIVGAEVLHFSRLFEMDMFVVFVREPEGGRTFCLSRSNTESEARRNAVMIEIVSFTLRFH